MTTTIDPQTEINERELTSPPLERALTERQDAKTDRAAAAKKFKEADQKAKALLGEFNLAEGEVARIGQYKITVKSIPSRSVSFETDPSSRVQISLIPE